MQQAGQWLMTGEQFEEIFLFKIEAILTGKLELGLSLRSRQNSLQSSHQPFCCGVAPI